MAQTNFTTIVSYNSATASQVPLAADLTQGELAVNVTDKKVYTKNSGGSVVQVGSGPDATETLTNKTLTSPVISGGTINNAAIGGTTPAAGSFTTLAASGLASLNSISVSGAAGIQTIDDGGSVLRLGRFSSGYPWSLISPNAAGGGIEIRTNPGATIAQFSSTGLAVTGALSATGDILSGGANTPVTIFARGSNSGTNGGSALYAQVGATGSNTVTLAALGNYSNIMGGTYDAAGCLYIANELRIVVNGSTKATLDTSGNLGLGVTPSAWTSSFRAIDVGATASVCCESSVTSDVVFNGYYKPAVGFTYKTTGYASMLRQEGGAYKFYNAPSGTAGNPITFTQAMTLDASGNLLVGTTSSGASNTNSFVIAPSSGAFAGQHASGTASGTIYANFNYNAATIGSITQSGTTAVLYNTTSDQRLKKNIADAESASSLIDSIQVRQFDWKSDNSHQRYGMVAQELALVAPEAVHQPADPDDMMAVDYSKLVPMLVKEIQSLRGRLAALEAK